MGFWEPDNPYAPRYGDEDPWDPRDPRRRRMSGFLSRYWEERARSMAEREFRSAARRWLERPIKAARAKKEEEARAEARASYEAEKAAKLAASIAERRAEWEAEKAAYTPPAHRPECAPLVALLRAARIPVGRIEDILEAPYGRMRRQGDLAALVGNRAPGLELGSAAKFDDVLRGVVELMKAEQRVSKPAAPPPPPPPPPPPAHPAQAGDVAAFAAFFSQKKAKRR